MNACRDKLGRHSIAMIAMIATLLLASSATVEAAPFDVHKSDQASRMAEAPVIGTTTAGSFDDVVGSLEDGLDACYLVRDTAGGSVTISVEKDTTLGTVRLVFEPSNLSLRDQAVVLLEDLTAVGGAFDELMTEVESASKKSSDAVEDALEDVLEALDTLRSGDFDEDADTLHHPLKDAIGELLMALHDLDGSPAVEGLIEQILDAARMIAVFHLDRATAACGACGEGGPFEQCFAESRLADGDLLRSSVDPNYKLAVMRYSDVVTWAIDALGVCS